jgi:hypothetical protein
MTCFIGLPPFGPAGRCHAAESAGSITRAAEEMIALGKEFVTGSTGIDVSGVGVWISGLPPH